MAQSNSAGQAIRNAIEAELHAARFYELLADSTDDPESKGFLTKLAELEREHANSIRKIGEPLVSGPLPVRADSDVTMVETLPEWRFVDGLTLPEALEIAHAAENQAALYYDAFADFFEGPVQTFFRELSQTEQQHAQEIARRLARPSRP